MPILSADQTTLIERTDVLAHLVEFAPQACFDIALEPVLCIDCETYVPFGWINTTSAPKCTVRGSSGTAYGHRVSRAVYDSLMDKARTAAFEAKVEA